MQLLGVAGLVADPRTRYQILVVMQGGRIVAIFIETLDSLCCGGGTWSTNGSCYGYCPNLSSFLPESQSTNGFGSGYCSNLSSFLPESQSPDDDFCSGYCHNLSSFLPPESWSTNGFGSRYCPQLSPFLPESK